MIVLGLGWVAFGLTDTASRDNESRSNQQFKGLKLALVLG